MGNIIIGAPGNDLKTFVNHISFDLKKRKVEYSVVGFFNGNGQPIGMIETKGRSSWVECSSNQVIETARKLKASGICLLHNHPRNVKESPCLKPSTADISFLREFISALDGTGLKYLGSWITSNGHLTETLHTIQTKNNPEIDTSLFSDSEITSLLTPDLKDTIQQLTKTLLLQVNWYNISETYLYNNKVEFKVKSIKYWGEEDEVWVFSITAEDSNNRQSGDVISVEQAIKAYDAIIELQNVSSKLITTDLEYTEVNVDIGVNIKCGFYQTGVKQGAFLYLGTNQMFLKVAELGCISDFIAAGLEKIDSVLNQIEK